VLGCPFQIDILASPDERPEVGDKIRLEFTHDLPASQLQAHVADANGKHVPANVSDSGLADGMVAVTFVALSKGQHNVQLVSNDETTMREVQLEVEVSPCLGSDARYAAQCSVSLCVCVFFFFIFHTRGSYFIFITFSYPFALFADLQD
jgi:hypothetical protein